MWLWLWLWRCVNVSRVFQTAVYLFFLSFEIVMRKKTQRIEYLSRMEEEVKPPEKRTELKGKKRLRIVEIGSVAYNIRMTTTIESKTREHLKLFKNVWTYSTHTHTHRMCACASWIFFFEVSFVCEWVKQENFKHELLWIFSIYTSDTVVFLSHLFLV